jgi:uncharacterized protein (UPF0276 family)
MAQIGLAATGGKEHIEALLASGETRLDRVKVGSYMDDARLEAIAATHPVLLHVSEGAAWPRTVRWIDGQIRRARRVGTPWVSAHLDLGSPWLAYQWTLFPVIPRSLAVRWAVRTFRRWVARSPVPVLAENMPRWGHVAHPYLIDPEFITQVVKEAGCRLLLDLAHARVSASTRREPARDYIGRLPLDRVDEIHLSGPRPLEGSSQLVDAHRALQEEDYALLAWVLGVTRPFVVTLEYSRDRALLQEQLLRLRSLLDQAG